MKRLAGVFPLLFLTSLLAACENPLVPVFLLEPDPALSLLAVLDPGEPSQVLLIRLVEVGGSLEDVRVEVATDDGPVLQLTASAEAEIDPCIARYGGGAVLSYTGDIRCVELPFRPVPMQTYTVTVRAEGRPTARGTATIPGDFDIVSVDASGSPPGTERLEAHWTASARAHRYFVALRPQVWDCSGGLPDCSSWGAEVTDTVLDTEVPPAAVEAGTGPWHLDIIALEQQTYEYLASGTGNWTFGVPPVQNVSGGHGLVGAWNRRSVPIESE